MAGRSAGRGTLAMVELLRLGIVGLFTSAGFALGPTIADVADQPMDVDRVRFLMSLLGALVGYVAGGTMGRAMVRGVGRVEERLSRVESTVLIAAAIGGSLAALLAFAFSWPVLFLPGRRVTVPVAMFVAVVLMYTGVRLGAARGGDLARFVGVRGRIQVAAPAKGLGVKVVDSSALVDGRLLDIARAGFLEGTLVIPQFVIAEMQAMASSDSPLRQERGRRGLDVLAALQDDAAVTVEVTDEDVASAAEVDAKLAELAKRRGATLITLDAGLARAAEATGVRVLNVHRLAEAVRLPVVPGDRIALSIVKEGREPGQGVGYLDDATMVVVERVADRVGQDVEVDITSVTQTRNGRMLFAVPTEA